jgi:hypothetical protein
MLTTRQGRRRIKERRRKKKWNYSGKDKSTKNGRKEESN